MFMMNVLALSLNICKGFKLKEAKFGMRKKRKGILELLLKGEAQNLP
jgi:hypothetical protein